MVLQIVMCMYNIEAIIEQVEVRSNEVVKRKDNVWRAADRRQDYGCVESLKRCGRNT